MTTQILPAVAAAIFNEHGEILLQKHRDVNKWCIISGHVEFREVEEETNANATIIRFIGIYSSPASQTYNYEDRTVQYLTSYFEARLDNTPSPDFSNNETQELKFFRPKDIPDELALVNSNWLTDALDNEEIVFIR